MNYVNTYLRAPTRDDCLALRGTFRNVTDPAQGRSATDEYTDENGNVIQAQEAVGDPAYWYCLVTHFLPVPSFGLYEVVDPSIGIILCGEA